MGRYKFPGKPMKHVNKKRVNVLSCSSTESNETSIDCNEELETFNVCKFNWDKNKKIKYPKVGLLETLEDQHRDTGERNMNVDELKCISLPSNTSTNNSDQENITGNNCARLSIVRRTNKHNEFLYKNYPLKYDNNKAKSSRKIIRKKELRIVSKADAHELVTKKIASYNTRRSLYRRKRQIKDISTASRIHDRDSTNLVGKFVLPSRSLHSSRVIKPNKRFINSEQVFSKSNEVDNLSRNNKRSKSYRTVARNNVNENESDPSHQELDIGMKNTLQSHSSSDSFCNKNISEFCLPTENKNFNSQDSNDVLLIDSTGSTNVPRSCSKLILRKAKLQLRNHVCEDMDGPFSSYSASTPSPPGTVTCGVCGAVRFYRFVKQARKFNIYSCESCRKFISKMIKRQSCSITTLVCHKGQGMCHVPPIVRSQQWKLLRCAYKARCPACWLKMCLQSFQMPSQLKLNLTSMLPENMRIYEDCKLDFAPDINKLRNLHESQNTDTNDASQPILQEQLEKKLETSISPVKLDILSLKTDTLLKDVKSEKMPHKSRTRVATQKKIISASKEPLNTMHDCTKRQKIFLKGPRVKHVCRSASIVLGQPIATFSGGCIPDDADKSRSLYDSSETDACTCTSVLKRNYGNIIEEKCLNVIIDESSIKNKVSNSSILSMSATANNVCSSSLNFTNKIKNNVKHHFQPVITISMDYFDNYDSESKIYSSGFGLIGSEPFAIQAVCFYCGSAGQEQLLYCDCCCEPFHSYCINDSVIYRYLLSTYKTTQFNLGTNTKSSSKLPWTCSRCSICYKCGKSDESKRTCQLCQRYYHSECMQSTGKNSTQLTICSLCLRCEDCGSQSIATLVSNLFVCSPCFKMRMQEKCCVLCHKYDNDSNTKFVKCGRCLNIIHAKCEKLTDEMYEIIHHLPSSSTYLCSTCSFEKNTSWRDNVKAAIKNGFHIILRLLTRNPSAKNIMKWNLLKNISCSCGGGNIYKNISYREEYDFENIETNSDITMLDENLSESMNKSRYNNLKETDNVKDNKDSTFDISLKRIQENFCIRECSVRVKNCLDSRKKNISNTVVRVQNNDFDKYGLKNHEENRKINNTENLKTHCNKHDVLPIFLLLNIKRKINKNIYKTVQEFHLEVQQALIKSFSYELLNILDCVIEDTFPWYNPKSHVNQEDNFIYKTAINISQPNNINSENIISSRNQTLPGLVKEKADGTVSNKYLTENKIDTRVCVLCHKVGDGIVSVEGRLLYCDQDEWVHINCAFWSTRVYEELDCSLQNVHEVISNSRKNLCSLCNKTGASVSCSIQSCNTIYHYVCARLANCCFFSNKTICCSAHYKFMTNETNVIGVREFEMQRPVYIQYDMKKNRNLELSKVQYLIGCLNVTNLGSFYPILSDTEEAIIPSEFVCSRLFWSTNEPWKMVRYAISTSILIPTSENIKEPENNFTIEHSNSDGGLSQKVEIVKPYTFDYGKYGNKLLNIQTESVNFTDDNKIVLQILENILEHICSKEEHENCDDEPQSTADILPPELKDAIFEDLPHDLLDRISVQDIFPKLMSYEDIITTDLKVSNAADGDLVECNCGSKSWNNDIIHLQSRKSDILLGNDMWLDPKCPIHSLEKYSKSDEVIHGPHLKRSKSEIFTGIKKITRACSHQRSCSLTWSYKLDNSRPLSTKKRKLTCPPKSVADISNNLFMLVDGNNEKNSMLQELRLSDSVLMSVGHSANVDCLSDSVEEIQYCLAENREVEHEKENSCRAWRNKAHSKIIQLDGADDSSSASDNESCSESTSDAALVNLNKSIDEPVQCEKCQCTYRTHNSYKKHLTICVSLSSSESDSESDEPSNSNHVSKTNFNICNKLNNKAQNCTTEISMDTSIVSQTPSYTRSINSNLNSICTDNNYIMSHSLSVDIPLSGIRNETSRTVSNNTDCKQKLQRITVNQCVVNNTELVTSSDSNVKRSHDKFSSLTSIVENSTQKSSVAKAKSLKKVIKQRINIKTRRSSVAQKNKKIALKRTQPDKSDGLTKNNPQTVNTNRTMQSVQNAYDGLGSTLIIQHLSSPNLLPSYVEAFQQQTGQNLQCIGTIVPNEYKSVPFITTNSFIPAGLQIHTSESSSLLSIPNDGFSLISGLDTISQSRPMLTPFVHQNRPVSNFQCGMVSTEQLFVRSVPTVDPVLSDIQNSFYLSSTPLCYGFEAIVHNTIMSSQQFISASLPGALSSNSSYSTTTTQVFQSSKVEPIIDMNGTSYIVVNSIPPPLTVNSHPLFMSFEKQDGLFSHSLKPVVGSPSPVAYPVQILPFNDQLITASKSGVVEPAHTLIESTEPFIEQDVSTVISKEPDIRNSSMTVTNVTSPCSSENKVIMNVVTPVVQLSSTTQVLKPTNRVLPMQVHHKLHTKNNKVVPVETPDILNKLSQTVDKIQKTLQNDAKSLQSTNLNSDRNQLLKLKSTSLKLVFQKQSEDGIYKISKRYVSQKKVPIKNAPCKKKTVHNIENEMNIKNGDVKEKIGTQPTNNKMLSKSKNNPSLLYKVQAQNGFNCTSTSLTELWKSVFNALQSARTAHKMPLLPDDAFNVFSGLQLLGLNSNGLKYLIEQLPGVENCVKYKPISPRNVKFPEYEDITEDKTFKAARCEPYVFNQQPYDMFSWLASEHRNLDYVHLLDYDYVCRKASTTNLPMAMRFRQLKETSKQTVGVYRSGIHGRGLFCLRNIECGEMVIEYAGEVIRSTLTDKREKYYNSKGIGCYMFRVDDNFVIDATMKGNAARFINHSCDPNCYSRVLEILGHKHILIFALRKIIQGEELTYDYKFPFEEDKIPCTCGAKRCRKYLN